MSEFGTGIARIYVDGEQVGTYPIYVSPDTLVDEQERCWATAPQGGDCSREAETDVGLCLRCRDEIRARVDDG